MNTPLEARKHAWGTEAAIAAALEKGLGGDAAAADDAASADGLNVEGVTGRVLYETQGLSGRLGAAAMHFRRHDPVLTCTCFFLVLSVRAWVDVHTCGCECCRLKSPRTHISTHTTGALLRLARPRWGQCFEESSEVRGFVGSRYGWFVCIACICIHLYVRTEFRYRNTNNPKPNQ